MVKVGKRFEKIAYICPRRDGSKSVPKVGKYAKMTGSCQKPHKITEIARINGYYGK